MQCTGHMQTIDVYWQLKTIMGKVLVVCSVQQKFLLSMDEVKRKIRRLDNKIATMACQHGIHGLEQGDRTTSHDPRGLSY